MVADERRMREGCKKKKKTKEGRETTTMSERMIKCEKWNEEERDRKMKRFGIKSEISHAP